jgi:hypothetical protein
MHANAPHRRVAAVAGIVAAAALAISPAGALAGTKKSESTQPPKVQHTDFSFTHYVDKSSTVLF